MPGRWVSAIIVLTLLTPVLACSSASSGLTPDQSMNAIIKTAMSYIKSHHEDAALFIPDDIAFTRIDAGGKGKIGYSYGTYGGVGWIVTVGHAVTAEIIYDISADYLNGKITWKGICRDGAITELSYKKSE